MTKKTSHGLLLAAVCSAVFPVSLSAEGLGGLAQAIDTPRAASGKANDLVIALDYRENYRALSFGFQPSERFEIGISFPTYDEGSGSSSGNELSFGLRLIDEGAYVPSVTVGIVGFGSDDRGSGEYLAFGKSFGPINATAGIGWGRYGQDVGGGRGEDDGVIRTDHLFAGDTEGFASIVWNTGVDGLSALAEYSGVAGAEEDDTYALGLSYEVSEGLFLTGFGNNQGSYGLRLTFAANPNEPYVQSNIGRGPHPFVENRSPRPVEPNAEQVLAVARERLEKEGISIRRFAMAGDTIDVTPSSANDLNFARTTGRVARVLSAVAPASIKTFRITQNTGAFDSNVIVLDRAGLGAAVSQPDAAALAWDATTFEASPMQRPEALAETPFEPRFTYGLSPSFRADFVTSDELELTGTLTANARYTFSPQTFVAGAIGYRFLNQWTHEDPPESPEIRSDLTSYTPDEIYLQSLTVRHRFRLAPEIYGRVSAGLFERAFGGVSGEVLWRPPQQDFALGLEVSNVQKRAYEDWFGFEDLNATTVIGSLYANVGENGNFFIVDAGQYLAGDLAMDLTVGRNFGNGWRIAASTGWSEESDAALKFGAELSIPLAWTSPDGGKQRSDLSVGGPSGNFGSRVSGTGLLYGELRQSDRKRIEDAWGQFWN